LGVPCAAIFFGDQHRSTHSIDAAPFGNGTNNPELNEQTRLVFIS